MALMDLPEEVGCYDAVGRRRTLKLSRSGRGVTIVAPPGEVAKIGPAEIDELRLWLTQLCGAEGSSPSNDAS